MTIYKDCLGRPNAEGIISVFGTIETGYLAFSSVSDAPYKKWPYESKNVSDIVAEMEADGWECKVGFDGENAPFIKCIHKETQKLINDLKVESEKKFKNAEKGFIRFGDCPKNGKSFNYRDNIPEKGVSVFEAEFVNKEYRVILTPVLEATYLLVKNRPAYRLYGEVVGTGADGEPVIKVSKKIKL